MNRHLSGDALLFVWPFRAENNLIVAGWGFWLAIIGLILTLVGFAITLLQLAKTKDAATAVGDEVDRIRRTLSRYDAAQETAKAAYALTTTRRYLENESWQDVADSYEDIRRGLVQTKVSGQITDADLLKQIDNASLYIEKLCARIEKALVRPPVIINVSKTKLMLRRHDELIANITLALQRYML